METGPNDVKCVVWAICKVFFFLFRVFLLLTNVFRYHLTMGRQRPRKWAETTPNASFRPFVSYIYIYLCFITSPIYRTRSYIPLHFFGVVRRCRRRQTPTMFFGVLATGLPTHELLSTTTPLLTTRSTTAPAGHRNKIHS